MRGNSCTALEHIKSPTQLYADVWKNKELAIDEEFCPQDVFSQSPKIKSNWDQMKVRVKFKSKMQNYNPTDMTELKYRSS